MSEKNTRDFVKASADIFGDSQNLRERIKKGRRTILTEDRAADRVDEYKQGPNPDPQKGCLFCGPHKMTEAQLRVLNIDLPTGHAPLRDYSICSECRVKYQIKEGSIEARLWEAVGVKFIGTDEKRTDAKIDKTKVKMDSPPKNQGFKDETKDSVDHNKVKMDNPPGSAPNADQGDTKATGSMKHGEGQAFVKYMEPGGAWREFIIPGAIVGTLKTMAGIETLQEGKYKCEECGAKFKQEKKGIDNPIACPQCKSKKVEILEAVPGPDPIKDTEKKESPTVDKTKVHMDKPAKNVGEAGTKIPGGGDDERAKGSMGAKFGKLMDKGGKWREKDANLDAHSPTKEMTAILTTWGFMKDGQEFKDLSLETQAKLGALADTFFEKCENFFGEAAEGFEKKNISDASDTLDSVDRKKSGNVTVGKKNIGSKEVPSGPTKKGGDDAKAKGTMKHMPASNETAKPVKTEQVVAKSYLRKLFNEDDQKALGSMKHNPATFTDKGGTRREKGTEVHDLEKPLKKDTPSGGKEEPEFKGDTEKGKKETVPAGRHEAGKKKELKEGTEKISCPDCGHVFSAKSDKFGGTSKGLKCPSCGYKIGSGK